MKKLVQLKNKENENLDPINFNYEKRISNLEGKILYENASGSTGSITLNDNISNYKYIEIYFKKSNAFKYAKIEKPNINDKFQVEASDVKDGTIRIFYTIYEFNTSNSINPIENYYSYISPVAIGSDAGANYFHIVKIIGYK